MRNVRLHSERKQLLEHYHHMSSPRSLETSLRYQTVNGMVLTKMISKVMTVMPICLRMGI